jgi:hypothetical protein
MIHRIAKPLLKKNIAPLLLPSQSPSQPPSQPSSQSPSQLPLIPYSVALCAICKYEDLYIDEWIKYNLSIGFDAIHLYDNSDEFTLKGISDRYPGKVFVKHFPGVAKQYSAYNDFVVKNKDKYIWVAFIDCDEFIVLKKHSELKDFLNQYNRPNMSGICMNWYLFGSNGEKQYRPEYVTRRFTRRDKDVNKYVKTIVKLNDIILPIIDPHNFNTKYGTYDTNGNKVSGSLNPNGPNHTAYIHHYHIKSEEEYMKKIARRRATTTNKRTFEDFIRHDKNDVEDLTLYNYPII